MNTNEKTPSFSDDRPVPWVRRALQAALLPLGLCVLWFARSTPEWVELHFSNGLFPRVRSVLRAVSGALPLPLGQTLLIALLVGTLIAIGQGVFGWVRKKRSARNLSLHLFSRCLGSAGLLYALFLITWGLNHARLPYARIVGLELREVQVFQLSSMTSELLASCNELRGQVSTEDLQWRQGPGGVDPRVLLGYNKIGERVPTLAGGRPLLRSAFISPLLSALAISGIYSPMTAECHLNTQIPDWRHGFVGAHEVAHFKGFAREDEANFIAWQVCRESGNPALRYSATLTAALHCLKALESQDPIGALTLKSSLSDAVRADLSWSRRFWHSKRTKATRIAKMTNDSYLKSQGQSAGRQSYGRMVELLIAEWVSAGADG